MKFIDLLGNEIEFECLGCDVARHKLIPPGEYVYEDDFINVSADPEIPIPGFMVLGIKKHVRTMNELSKEERYRIIDILNLTIENIKKCGIANRVLVIQEERSRHFHIWIVPVHEWMKEYGESVKNIDKIINHSKEIFNEKIKEELLEDVDKLRESFKE